jgi:8-oxo-dGTP pyrophosphatase MutT (NUDIX family)
VTDAPRGGRQVVPRPDQWSPGPPASWVHTDVTVDVDLDRLRSVVPSEDGPLQPAFTGARHSAVLVTLSFERGPEVLLTRRSMHLRNHRGEMSFPGGRMDPGESPTETALREAEEEVGLDPRSVRIVGELDHLNTVVSRSYIVPKVAVVEGRPDLRPTSGEVERVMWVGLHELVSPLTHHSEVWGRPPTDRLLHFFELADETVWGATAHVLVDLLDRLHGHPR